MYDIQIFTAPKSYAEASRLWGRFITPDGSLCLLTSKGFSGVEGHPDATFTVGFDNGSVWHSVHGFRTKSDAKRAEWDARWKLLAGADRELILLAFPGIDAAANRDTKKPGAKLLAAAKVKFIKAGAVDAPTCGRCGGSGQYSFNQIDGSRCFGCGGVGRVFPTTSKALPKIRKFLAEAV